MSKNFSAKNLAHLFCVHSFPTPFVTHQNIKLFINYIRLEPYLLVTDTGSR